MTRHVRPAKVKPKRDGQEGDKTAQVLACFLNGKPRHRDWAALGSTYRQRLRQRHLSESAQKFEVKSQDDSLSPTEANTSKAKETEQEPPWSPPETPWDLTETSEGPAAVGQWSKYQKPSSVMQLVDPRYSGGGKGRRIPKVQNCI